MQSQHFDEETRGLLRKILEGQAYRQLMLANIRGHGIKFVPEVAGKLEVVYALDAALRQFQEIERLYSHAGFGDIVTAVRGKMERIPYPITRLELAMCLFLCERVSWHALSAYTDSVSRDLAAIARTRMEEPAPPDVPLDTAFVEFASEETNRPLAQQLFNRWLGVTLLSLGRPGSAGDERALAVRLRDKPVAQIAREYMAGLAQFVQKCHLSMPDAATLGLELPAPAKTAR